MTYSQMTQMAQPRLRRSQSVGRYEFSRRGLGPVANAMLLIAVLAIMGLIYLTQITKTSVFGFEVSELKDKKQALEEQNQNLRIEHARLQAVERIEQSQVAGQLTGVDDLTFAPGSQTVD
jgi:cell division protein FtsL